MSLERINNSLELARELSIDLETRTSYPSREDIQSAVNIMNQYLWSVKGDVPATFTATEAYLNVPESPETLEHLSQYHLDNSRIEKAIIKGKIDSFKWIGSTAMRAFGVHMHGVTVLAPRRMNTRTAFLPVEGVGTQFAA